MTAEEQRFSSLWAALRSGNLDAAIASGLITPQPDEPEPEPPCPICHGYHFVVPREWSPDNAQVRAVPCECQAENIARARRARLLGKAQVPWRYQRLNFETYRRRAEGDQDACAAVEYLAYNLQPHASVFIHGDTGGGKTGLALALMMHRILVVNDEALFIDIPDFLRMVRGTFDARNEGPTEAQLIEAMRTVGLLVWDDCGSESLMTPWREEQLYAVISYRSREGLSTVLTSNYDLPTLRENWGARIGSRVEEMCGDNVILVRTAPDGEGSGADLRKPR